MPRVGIVTDTVACLTQEDIQKYDIQVVPILLHINGRLYHDMTDITPEEFWKTASDVKEFSTAAPAPADFIKAFDKLGRTTDSIACTFVSKALSATWESAVQARDLFVKDHPEIKVEIIDSRTASGAEGFIVLEMARAAEAGKNLSEVLQVAQDMIPRVRYVTALDTLKHLIKIGRAPKTAYMGELFQVKPIIGMVNNTGEVENIGRARGTDKAMQKMVELMEPYIDPGKPVHINVHYSSSPENGELLKTMVVEKYKPVELYYTPFSPVMGGAVGPVLSVSFYSEK
ncbi:MAG: DegV family protein [Dehalococcoidales bacterium]|jgi:DegV family protein with EDD domain|nr:DegV family protein [Dehalococcoidales bacterium]